MDRGRSAIHALLADPDLSAEARQVLSQWLAERSAALERAEDEPGAFLLR